MCRFLLFFSLIPLLLLGFCSCTDVNRKPEIRISLHQQGMAEETESFVQAVETPRGLRHFRKLPEVSQKHITAFQIFPQAHGNAVALKLDTLGTRKLYNITLQKMGTGEYLMLSVNGSSKDFLLMDSPIEDGVIMIWAGLTAEELIKLKAEVEHNNS